MFKIFLSLIAVLVVIKLSFFFMGLILAVIGAVVGITGTLVFVGVKFSLIFLAGYGVFKMLA
jgi:hypothetical protein